ncbi:lithostathine-like isoform X2 [Oscarella lobularis]|uniref:lithostathine-like isoform X2 n=1 Tax=Oscarella lobularis TaxID=121494 RepID=UPI003313987B
MDALAALSLFYSIFVRISGIPLENDHAYECPSGFRLHNAHCYRYFSRRWKRQFALADRMCENFNGGKLVSVHAHDELAFVNSIVDANESFWIGLTDLENLTREGRFVWTDGSVVLFDAWAENEPQNRNSRDCVEARSDRGWSMALSGCGLTEIPFVCKTKACPGSCALSVDAANDESSFL